MGSQHKKTQIFSLLLSVAMIQILGCGPQSSKKSGLSTALDHKGCKLNDDQKDSVDGRWERVDGTSPIRIAFRRGQFSASEQSQILKAAQAWNNYFLKNYGMIAFDYGTLASPYQIDFDIDFSCSKGIVDSSTGIMNSAVGIYKKTTRPATESASQTVATTGLCSYQKFASNKLRFFYYASIEANWIDFFANGKPDPGLHPTFLHELGHLLGVAHSCKLGSGDSTRSVLCSDLPSGHEYLSAVLYPQYNAAMGLDLKTNDVERASCTAGDPL